MRRSGMSVVESDSMDPITPGIISNLITQAASIAGQRFFGGQIKINDAPRS